jgi:hypothetical protein
MAKSPRGSLLIGLLMVGVVVLSLVTFLFILDLSNWIMRGDLDHTLAFGQLCFDALVLPTAAIGFLLAVREIRKAQKLPKLDLRWQKLDRTVTTTIDTCEAPKPA